jgi:hypothetical protein
VRRIAYLLGALIYHCQVLAEMSDAARRILRAMPVPPVRAWQLPWLRLHLFMRDVLAVPWGKDWPIVKRELAKCGA